MADLGNLFQKAVYLGVGLASYTTEKASGKLGELRIQAQKLADELVQRGEMTADEAKRMVEDMMQQSQAAAANASPTAKPPEPPRQINIMDGDESDSPANSSVNPQSTPQNPTTNEPEPSEADLQSLRQQVEALQEQLRRLKE